MATLTEEREREGSQIMTFNLKNNHEGMMVVARITITTTTAKFAK